MLVAMTWRLVRDCHATCKDCHQALQSGTMFLSHLDLVSDR